MRYLVEHFPAAIYNLPPEPHHSFQQRKAPNSDGRHDPLPVLR